MKKLKLIILFIAVLALAGSVFFLARKEVRETAPEETEQEFIIVKTVEEDIKEISLVNSSGVFAFEKQNGEWMNVFSERVKTSGNAIVAIESILKQSLAVDEVEKNVASLEKYGLDNPVATVKYVTESGKTGFLKLGNSIVGTKHYFTLDDKDVYTMDMMESGILLSGMRAFADMSIAKVDIDELEEVTIYSNDEKITVAKKTASELSTNGADALFTYTLRSPVKENASPENVQKFFTMISSVSASEYNPYAKDDECGFDVYEEYFTYTTAREKRKFIVGDSAGKGYTYVKVVGEKGAYKVSDEVLSFLDYTAFDLVDKHISLFYFEELKKVTIEADGEKYELSIGENVTLNGRVIETETAQDFYRQLISLSYEGSVEKEIKNPKREISITFETANVRDVTHYESYDAMNYAVSRNGAREFTIQRKYADKIISLIKEL